jgi:ABC-2 type transport system permease protein
MSAISVSATGRQAEQKAQVSAQVSALWRLILVEAKLLSRERVRLFITIGLPLVLIIILGSIPALRKPSGTFGGHSFIDYYTLVMVVFSAALLALTAVPLVLAGYRERGVLRRLRTTPIGPYRVLAAQLAAAFGICVVTTVLILLVARIGYNVPLPRQAAGFVVTAILATAALLSVGLVIASLAPTARTAQGIGALLFYVLMFFAGLWLPLPEMPKVLQHISHATPLGAAVQAMTNCSQGRWPTALELITLAAWTIALSIAAGKLFRWE